MTVRDNRWQRPAEVPLDRNGPTDVPFEFLPADFTERPLFEWFEARARRDPAATALVDRTDRLSYEAVRRRSLALAQHIQVTVPPGGAVAIWLRANAQLPLAILACLAAGRTALVLNHRNPAGRIASIIEAAKPAAVIQADHGSCRASITDGIRSSAIECSTRSAEPARWDPRAAVGPDDPAVVLYTSGSTGQPKGIVLPQRSILCRIRQVVTAWHMHSADRFLSLNTPPTIPGLTGCFASLLTGAVQVLGDILEDGAGHILALAEREGTTILVGLSSLLGGFVEVGGETKQLRRLRVVRATSDALFHDDVQQMRTLLPPDCHVMTALGSTEMITFAQWFVPPVFEQEERKLPVGYPLPDHEFKIVGEDGQAVTPGDVGELVVRSRNIALGEWVGGRWAAGRLLKDPNDPSKRILFTGDLVRQRPDGLIVFVGRGDDQVKVRGQRVELAEIESALRAMPEVEDAAVAAAPDGDDVVLRAFVVSGDTPPGERQTLLRTWRTSLAKVLPDYMLPSTLTFVERLPRLASGKIDRRALLAGEGRSSAD
jgi:acyl-coenzyme A synthetase/AMP-(fatty) acid ligase